MTNSSPPEPVACVRCEAKGANYDPGCYACRSGHETRTRSWELEEAKKPKLFVVFSTPSYDKKVTLTYLTSMLRTIKLLEARGIRWELATLPGDPYLAKARNACASAALQQFPDMTHFFFLDADIEWDAQGALKLIESGLAVTAGIYPKKSDTPDFPCELAWEGAEMADGKPVLENGRPKGGQMIEHEGFLLARKVPTGFLCIRREVLVKMAEISGRYRDPMLNNMICWNIFQSGFCADNAPNDPEGLGEFWGEDYAWCVQWEKMGGQMWVWPDINFGHSGEKTWHNNMNGFVEAARSGGAKLVYRGEDGQSETFDAPATEKVAA